MSPREPRILGRRTILEYESGDFNQGEAYLERLLEAMRLTEPGPALVYGHAAIVIPLVARITGARNRFDVAHDAAVTVLSSPSGTPG